MFEVTKIEDKELKEQIARTVLEDLPEWFDLPESTAKYIDFYECLGFKKLEVFPTL